MKDNLFQKIKRDSSQMDEKTLVVGSLFVFVVALFMCIVNICANTIPIAWLTGGISLWFLLNIIMFNFFKKKWQLLLGMMSAAYAMMMYFVVSGGVDGFSIVWLVIIPPAAMYCFKLYYGGIFSVVIGASLWIYMYTPLFELGYPYTATYKLRFPILYTFVTVLCMIIQYRVFVAHQSQMELIQKLEYASDAKSEFLANMSHEIRTPMNAIIGMCELILRDEISDTVRENCFNIQNSGRSLLSIINDVLDFSKIESGKTEIIEEKFNIGSTINDVINMALTRKGDKNVELIVRVDPDVPVGLIGDEMRIRQVMINLMTNAMKFTKEGCVVLKVSQSRQEYGINLSVSITDTGIGISEENIEKLFTSFQRVDTKKNRSVEGTGLGLPISKRFINKMGGFINVSSVYGEGSEFRFVIPLKVSDDTPFIDVSNVERIKVLVYLNVKKYKHPRIEREYTDLFREIGRKSNVKCTFCRNLEDLEEMFIQGGYAYCFTEKEEYLNNEDLFTNISRHMQLVVIQERFNAINLPENIKCIYKPFYAMSFAAVLNNERYIFNHNEKRSKTVRFVAPEARVLIVDDNAINLKVATGLMKAYEMQIETADSGKAAIELLKNQNYDLVFMDHMMPEMDGVEATQFIRKMDGEYYKSVPIIALTANAINGVKEMFIESGFNDFMAKPIETSVLDRILAAWLPDNMRINSADILIRKEEKQEPEKNVLYKEILAERNSNAKIDVEKGLVYSGGMFEFYMDILNIYVDKAEEYTHLLNKFYADEDWNNYIINVHALKSTSLNIGAAELSDLAAACEIAGKNKDYDFIKEKHGSMMQMYAEVVEEGRNFIEDNKAQSDEHQKKTEQDTSVITFEQLEEYIQKLNDACENFEMDKMETLVTEISGCSLNGKELQGCFEKIKRLVDDFEYELVAKEAGKVLEELRGECYE